MPLVAACIQSTLCAQSTLAPPATVTLPLRDVVLFSSGVGYFGRVGTINGSATIPLSFRAAQVNDILKSLVLFDAGGGVRPVTFATKDSLSRQLGQSGINVDGNSSLGQLLRRFQGARVRLQVNGGNVEGRILSVSMRSVVDEKNRNVSVEIVNVLTVDGMRAISLDEVSRVSLLDEKLNRDLQSTLELQSTSFDNERREVNLNFEGGGTREVRAGYLLETPVWKTSYRLVLDSKGRDKPFLQGWGLIENTSDDDWNAVRLSLVSGRPISFVQDLYQPLYVPRPVVAPQIVGSPRPQLYGEAVEEARNAPVAAGAPAPPFNSAQPSRALRAPAAGGGFGGAGGAGGLFDLKENGVDKIIAVDPQNGLLVYGTEQAAAIAAQASGGARGELFEYAIKTPVTLPKNQAAMVPIVSEAIGGDKVSIFNPAADRERALNGFRLKNTSGLHLAGGPITVFQDGVYAGDAQIGNVGPKEDRLLSYAVDLELVPALREPTQSAETLSFAIKSGVLTTNRKLGRTLTYTFRNKAVTAKKVLVQQAIEADWKVLEPKQNVEKTASEYRFAVDVPAGKTVELRVVSERLLAETIALLNADFDALLESTRNAPASPALKAALGQLIERRRKVSELQRQNADLEKELQTIDAEQTRIRQNMAQLDHANALYQQYVQKLTSQEARIEKIRTEIARLGELYNAAQTELRDYVNGLNLA